jgi:hypothetical protein
MRLSTHRLVLSLAALDLAAVLLYVLICHVIAVPSFTITNWFDLDAEKNFPTYLSSIQLLLVAALSAWRANQHFEPEDRHLKAFYRLLALGFLFLSIDEATQIHEGVSAVVSKLGVVSPFPGGHGIWLLVYPVLAIPILAIAWRGFVAFVREPPGPGLFLLGAALFIGGGALVEMESYAFAQPGELSQYLFVTIEESLELAGQLAMIAAMLQRNRESTLALTSSRL